MAVAVVVIQSRERAGKIHGPAVSAADADEAVVHLKIDVRGPLNVIADKQVEIAVVVIIKPRRAGAPVSGGTADAGLGGDLLELAAAIVSEQMVAPHRGDKHVFPSIVVVVANGHTHAVATQVQPGTGGDIGEMTVAVGVVKRHRGRL